MVLILSYFPNKSSFTGTWAGHLYIESATQPVNQVCHDDAITWKHFPLY